MERAAQAHAQGVGNGQVVFLLDMKGVSMSIGELRTLTPYFKSLTKALFNYQGFARLTVVARAPWIVRLIKQLVFPWLPPTTRSKVRSGAAVARLLVLHAGLRLLSILRSD